MARRQMELSNEVAAELAGSQDVILRALEEHLECDVFLRGNVITLDGEADAVQARRDGRARAELELVERGHEIGPATIESVDPRARPARVARQGARGRRLAPPQLQRRPEVRQPEALRRRDPPPTRSRSASAPPAPARRSWPSRWPTAALARREVNRIILTRPAVEAGERLGFLPGDLMAKVDPYLRPLFDALHDMIDAEKVAAPPRARRDRGRAAGLHAWPRAAGRPARCSRPTGWPADRRAPRSATSSSARTAGRRRCSASTRRAARRSSASRAQDGASTLCLRRAPVVRDDAGRPQARQAGPRRRDARDDRPAAPRTTAPLRAAARARRSSSRARPVPIDPYALGLLLGDGCLTDDDDADASRRRTRSSPRRSRPRSPAIELRRKASVDYVLRHVDGGRGGVIVANPVTAALRELGLAGTRSTTKFVPDEYLLQRRRRPARACCRGCSTRDGGPVTPARPHAAAIQYTTCSRAAARRRRLPRPLARRRGLRTRAAARGPPARAAPTDGRCTTAPTRYVLDIRLPAGIEPFRLDAQARRVRARRRRPADALRRHRSSRRARPRRVCIQVARRRLAVRDRRLPRHAQHAQRLASSSSTRRRTPRPSR